MRLLDNLFNFIVEGTGFPISAENDNILYWRMTDSIKLLLTAYFLLSLILIAQYSVLIFFNARDKRFTLNAAERQATAGMTQPLPAAAAHSYESPSFKLLSSNA